MRFSLNFRLNKCLPNPVAQAAPGTDHLLPPREGRCPPGDAGVNDHDYGDDHLNQDVTMLVKISTVQKMLTSIWMAIAGEGEEGIVAPVLPPVIGRVEL